MWWRPFLFPPMDTIEELQVRAQAVVSASQKDYAEMGAVHRAITGTHYACTPCNERRILFTLTSFITNPERYALRIKEAQIEMEEVKTSNYRFSKKATSKLIVLVTAFGTIKITPETLTDEKAEMVLQHRMYAHNIERIPGTELEEEDTDEAEAEAERLAKIEAEQEAENQRLAALAKEEEEKAAAEAEAERLAKVENTKAPVAELTLEQAKVRFEEVTGNKPGSRNLTTLLAGIKKAEEAK